MKHHMQKNKKRKRGEKSTRINVLDYLTGTFFIVLVILIIYGMVAYALNL